MKIVAEVWAVRDSGRQEPGKAGGFKMRKWIWKAAFVWIGATLFLGACGQAETSESELSVGQASGADISIPEASPMSDAASQETGQAATDEAEVIWGEGIVVANLYGESPFFSGRVADFSKENPVYGIQYLDAYEGAEPDRILMEAANGKGPDVLYLNRSNVEALQSNEALGEIGQLISEENRSALLPGAIQMGTYGDRLLAVPLSVYVRSLVTNRGYWQEENWTAEDILSVLEGHPEIEGMFLDMAGADEYFYNMYFMIGMDIRNSPFLKDGDSSFDCREFRDMLAKVKDMTKNAVNNSTPADRMLPLTEGKYLGIECFVTGMKNYCDIYAKMGDNANLVGYPYDMGNSHYLMDGGMLAINRNAIAKEGVSELVNQLLSLEDQQYVNYAVSVRADIPESQLVYNREAGRYDWTTPSGMVFPVAAKPDGSSYLEEYVAFLKSASPVAFDSDEVFRIVMEEADSYFNDKKGMDEVIDIIQSRVQLYLDERK